jgi:hypothetical protein
MKFHYACDVHGAQPRITIETAVDDEGKIIFFPPAPAPCEDRVAGPCPRCGRPTRPLRARRDAFRTAKRSTAELLERILSNRPDAL